MGTTVFDRLPICCLFETRTQKRDARRAEFSVKLESDMVTFIPKKLGSDMHTDVEFLSTLETCI